MKIAAVVLCFVFLSGCNKENDKNGLTELNGRWELRVTDGGYSYEHKIYPEGNGNAFIFSGDNQYQHITIVSGEKDTASGIYSVTRGATCSNADVTFIKFSDGEPGDVTILSVSGDSLYLKTNGCIMADGVDRTYVKNN